jgi:alpha-D-xyloside xylohydrolase
MIRYPFALILTAIFCFNLQSARANDVQTAGHDVVVKVAGGQLRLQGWRDRTIRVTFTSADVFPKDHSLSVIESPDPKMGWTVGDAADSVAVKTNAISARVDRASGVVTFSDLQGNVFLAESPNGHKLEATDAQTQPAYKVSDTFQLAPAEAIYGLGQHPDAGMNYAGRAIHLQQENRLVGIPVLMSSKGYGILWDNPAITDIDAKTPGKMTWSSETGQAIDYYVFFGPTIDQAIGEYRALTGAAPMLPAWAFGLWQSRERYSSQDELLWVVNEYQRRHIPLDVIVQDWQYWSPNPWGSHILDGSRYYDVKSMMNTLHSQGIHVMISVWAKFDTGSKNYTELDKAGVLYPQMLKSVYPAGQNRWYDPFSETGRQLYWKQMNHDLFARGLDGWWLDATEPELSGKWGEFRTFPTAMGSGATVFNAYPLMTTKAVYDGQRAQTADKRVVILTRSAYAGQQRNAAITWSGDIRGDWKTLQQQIPAGLNFCLSGIPYWNTDIGGFFGSKPTPEYGELLIRWFQFGCFCPITRIHGTDYPKEIWRQNSANQKIMVDFDTLRYRLFPYIYSTAWRVTNDNYTMMRGLAMDFADDPKALAIPDQYMFGPAILASPVTQAKATSRSVYLPAHATWYDFWTGKKLDGGQSIDADAPIEKMPLHIRAGSILPMGPEVQSTGERPSDPLELRVYPGASGAFTLYEDEKDNYNYEKGAHATIPIAWDDAKKTLTIGDRMGEFPGMLKSRTFRIVWVRDGVGAGIAAVEKPDVEITYNGQSQEVPMPAAAK